MALIKIKTIEQTCFACPSQWDIMTEDGQYIYARFRWGYLSVKINPWTPNEKILFEWQDTDGLNGVMDSEELQQLTKNILDWSNARFI